MTLVSSIVLDVNVDVDSNQLNAISEVTLKLCKILGTKGIYNSFSCTTSPYTNFANKY